MYNIKNYLLIASFWSISAGLLAFLPVENVDAQTKTTIRTFIGDQAAMKMADIVITRTDGVDFKQELKQHTAVLDLEPGRYHIKATINGITRERDFIVSSGGSVSSHEVRIAFE